MSLKYKNKDLGLFRIGNKIHKITKRMAKKYNGCYMTAMNKKVYKLTGVSDFAWFDDDKADYYLAKGNFWD